MTKVSRDFFGMMYQGSSVDSDGNFLTPYYPIPVGVQRLWDTGGTLTGMGSGPDFNLDGLNSQVRLAERNGSKVLFCFGFSAHWIEHPESVDTKPPVGALLLGSKTRPTIAYLAIAAEALMDFSVGEIDDQSRRIHIIEEWNEPAVGSHYWDVGTPEDCYVQSLMLYTYCKSRDPGIIMLSPSFNALDQHYGLDFMQRYVNSMRARGNGCDAIAFHLYAKTVAEVYTTLDNLDKVCGDLNLDYFCTEFNGPWEAYDIMGSRDIKLVTHNGQQLPSPYASADLANQWSAMYNRLTTVGPNIPIVTPEKRKRGGCL